MNFAVGDFLLLHACGRVRNVYGYYRGYFPAGYSNLRRALILCRYRNGGESRADLHRVRLPASNSDRVSVGYYIVGDFKRYGRIRFNGKIDCIGEFDRLRRGLGDIAYYRSKVKIARYCNLCACRIRIRSVRPTVKLLALFEFLFVFGKRHFSAVLYNLFDSVDGYSISFSFKYCRNRNICGYRYFVSCLSLFASDHPAVEFFALGRSARVFGKNELFSVRDRSFNPVDSDCEVNFFIAVDNRNIYPESYIFVNFFGVGFFRAFCGDCYRILALFCGSEFEDVSVYRNFIAESGGVYDIELISARYGSERDFCKILVFQIKIHRNITEHGRVGFRLFRRNCYRESYADFTAFDYYACSALGFARYRNGAFAFDRFGDGGIG